MKNLLFIAAVVIGFASCNTGTKVPTFTVKGSFANTGADKIYLAELPFGSQERIVVDTATIDTKGRFELSTPSKGEGIYQLFVENGPGMMLINDVDKLEFNADATRLSQYQITGGKANADLKNLYSRFLGADSVFRYNRMLTDSIFRLKNGDSAFDVARRQTDAALQDVRMVLENFIKTEANGTAVYFALGMAQAYYPQQDWEALLQSSLQKFPQHPGIALLKLPPPEGDDAADNTGGWKGKNVPDISLADTTGKMISVSSFKGKWLLIDFWASWCQPCRAENPNVVAAYQQFKNKNFTILGISLDQKKEPWVKAIQQDGLAWTHISDLKYWNSQAVQTYGFEGIPFNMLVSPEGKVVATDLRGDQLKTTLSQYVK